MNTPMGIILLNPEKENMAIREGIVRALRWLTSQNQQWLFWIAETSSVNGRSVCSMFSVRNTTDSMLFLLPSTTWKPTLVKQLHDNNLTEIDGQDRLSEIMDKTCDALKVLSAQREKLNTLRKDRAEQEEDLRRAQQKESQERKEREEKEKEKEKEKEEKDKKKEEDNDNKEKDVRSARNARVNAEPVLGSTIRVKSQNGTRQRKFKTGANFQEVYDWAGAIESFPLYFTLHRGGVLVSHAETIEQDETLNVTEREEAEMEHFFRNKVSFKGNFNFRESLSETLKDEDIEKEGESDEEMEKEKNVGEKRKRKRKSKDDKRTTAKGLKKKKEKNL